MDVNIKGKVEQEVGSSLVDETSDVSEVKDVADDVVVSGNIVEFEDVKGHTVVNSEDEGSEDVRRRKPEDTDNRNGPGFIEDPVRMKKNVGLISGTSFIVGSIIGSGIFISPKGVLKETGSVGLSLIVWTVGGLLSLLGGLAYAELGLLIPKSGGEYPYIMEGLGRVIAYLFAWTKVVVLTPSALAVITLTFAEYMVTLFPYCGNPQIPIKLIAAAAIVALGIINCWDTKLAANVQVLFTVAKLIALGIIIIGGLVRLGQGNVSALQNGFEGTTNSPSRIALAFYDCLWAYDAWNNLNYVTEELQKPVKNLPRAIIIGVSMVTVIYVLANISYLVVLGADGLLSSSAVAVSWGEDVLGKAGIIMPIFVMFSTFGAANGALFAGGRTVYAAARENQLPEILSYVNCKRYTPIPSIVFTCTIAILMLIPLNIGGLIDFFSFAAWLFYALTIISLLVLRWTKKDAHRPIKLNIVLAIIFLLCSLYLVVAPVIQDPRIEFLYAFLFIVGGLVLYIPLVHFKLHKGCLDPVTMLLQLFLEVAPSPYVPEEF